MFKRLVRGFRRIVDIDSVFGYKVGLERVMAGDTHESLLVVRGLQCSGQVLCDGALVCTRLTDLHRHAQPVRYQLLAQKPGEVSCRSAAGDSARGCHQVSLQVHVLVLSRRAHVHLQHWLARGNCDDEVHVSHMFGGVVSVEDLASDVAVVLLLYPPDAGTTLALLEARAHVADTVLLPVWRSQVVPNPGHLEEARRQLSVVVQPAHEGHVLAGVDHHVLGRHLYLVRTLRQPLS